MLFVLILQCIFDENSKRVIVRSYKVWAGKLHVLHISCSCIQFLCFVLTLNRRVFQFFVMLLKKEEENLHGNGDCDDLELFFRGMIVFLFFSPSFVVSNTCLNVPAISIVAAMMIIPIHYT